MKELAGRQQEASSFFIPIGGFRLAQEVEFRFGEIIQ